MKVVIDLNWLYPFLDSNFFVALVTFLSVLAVIFVYKMQKRDERENAARVILSEIDDAEDVLSGIKSNGLNLVNIKQVIQNNSWGKYKHFFAKELLERELKLLDNFYLQVELLNLELAQAYNLPDYWRAKAQIVAEQHMRFSIVSKTEKEYEEKKKTTLFFENDSYWWQPNSPKTQIIERVKTINYISTTGTYEKLNKIAYPKNDFLVFPF